MLVPLRAHARTDHGGGREVGAGSMIVALFVLLMALSYLALLVAIMIDLAKEHGEANSPRDLAKGSAPPLPTARGAERALDRKPALSPRLELG